MKIRFWGVRGSIPTPITGDIVEQKLRKALSLAKPGDVTSEESIEAFIKGLPFSLRSTYGGNSTCIEVVTDTGDLIIIDAGSGIRQLGRELMKTDFGKGRGVGYMFLTHTHWDHIQGIPFFLPFFVGEKNILDTLQTVRRQNYSNSELAFFHLKENLMIIHYCMML